VSQIIYFECHHCECHYAECRYAECHYAECRYAECRYSECRNLYFVMLNCYAKWCSRKLIFQHTQ
jgi:hypothetical protein